MAAGAYSFALNSLTSPGMVSATLAGLAYGGHMAEISKRDIWSPARVAQERPDVDYKLVAIDFLPVQVCVLLPRYVGRGGKTHVCERESCILRSLTNKDEKCLCHYADCD